MQCRHYIDVDMHVLSSPVKRQATLDTASSEHVLRHEVGLHVQHVVELERVQVQRVTGDAFRRGTAPGVVQRVDPADPRHRGPGQRRRAMLLMPILQPTT